MEEGSPTCECRIDGSLSETKPPHLTRPHFADPTTFDQGFWARPQKADDGSMNLMRWEAGIPGKAGTMWEGGLYKLVLEFPEEFPTKPPKCESFGE